MMIMNKSCSPPAWPPAARPQVLRIWPTPAGDVLERGRGGACRALERYMVDKLSAAESTFREMQIRMADPQIASDATEFQKVAKAAADLELTALTFSKHKELEKQLSDAQSYLKEVQNDPDMTEFAREEVKDLSDELAKLENKLKMLLLPRDPLDDKNIMLEIRAGAGGDEASIWAGDLYRLYLRWD
jgi:peptide chain release factor 1